jgi:hypothetical protein
MYGLWFMGHQRNMSISFSCFNHWRGETGFMEDEDAFSAIYFELGYRHGYSILGFGLIGIGIIVAISVN